MTRRHRVQMHIKEMESAATGHSAECASGRAAEHGPSAAGRRAPLQPDRVSAIRRPPLPAGRRATPGLVSEKSEIPDG